MQQSRENYSGKQSMRKIIKWWILEDNAICPNNKILLPVKVHEFLT